MEFMALMLVRSLQETGSRKEGRDVGSKIICLFSMGNVEFKMSQGSSDGNVHQTVRH